MGYAAPGDAFSNEQVDGVTYHRIPGPKRGRIPLDQWMEEHVQKVAQLVRTVRPAVLHAASDFTNALTARAVGSAYGIPVVYEVRGFWEESWLSRQAEEYHWDIQELERRHGLPEEYLWRREMEIRMWRHADHVATLANVMADHIAAAGVPRDRLTVVPNAVASEDFPVLGRNQELASTLGLGEDTIVIGYVSSLSEYEGINTLIDAYATVKDSSSTPVALLIVGDGPSLGHLMRPRPT
jgi:glycosyltransferase involved in cell wall biosynthesis